MHPELMPLDSLTAYQIDAWRALAERASEPNPFFEPEFVLPAAKHLDPAREVALLTVWDGGELVFVTPVAPLGRWRKLPVRVVANWCHLHCFVGTPLVVHDESVASSAIRAALDALWATRPTPHLVVLERCGTDGPVAEALQRAVPTRVYERYEWATAQRRPAGDYLDAVLDGRHRRELRRRARELARTTGGPAVTEDIAGRPGAIAAFLALERAGWKGRSGTALASDDATRRFIEDAWQGFDRAGRLHLLATETPVGTAAALCLLRAHDTVFMFKMAFDESMSRYSPGTQLVVDLYDWFQADPTIATIDTCAAPDDPFANRLFPDRRGIGAFLVAGDRVGAITSSVAPLLVAWTNAARGRTWGHAARRKQ
jgi:CelD/BcsL family acetyltransferase involved in cellulose biosynthesis